VDLWGLFYSATKLIWMTAPVLSAMGRSFLRSKTLSPSSL